MASDGTGAAKDGRAPTEELSCVWDRGFLFDGFGREVPTNGTGGVYAALTSRTG